MFPGGSQRHGSLGPWAKARCSFLAELSIQQLFLHCHQWKVLLIMCFALTLRRGVLAFLGENPPSTAMFQLPQGEMAQLSCRQKLRIGAPYQEPPLGAMPTSISSRWRVLFPYLCWSGYVLAFPIRTARCAPVFHARWSVWGPGFTGQGGTVPHTRPHTGACLLYAFVSSTKPPTPCLTFGIKG